MPRNALPRFVVRGPRALQYQKFFNKISKSSSPAVSMSVFRSYSCACMSADRLCGAWVPALSAAILSV